MKTSAAAETHVGLVRSNNEDAYCTEPDTGLFAVADGMGGHAAGEVASEIAVKVLRAWRFLLRAHGKEDFTLAFHAAHNAILLAAESGRLGGKPGMGTTLTALLLRDGRALVGHVGDSRCYRIREGKAEQLTRDHKGPTEHTVSNLLGGFEGALRGVDVLDHSAKVGDVFVLATDGLEDLPPTVADTARFDAGVPKVLADVLIARALDNGGQDNVTVVVVKVEE